MSSRSDYDHDTALEEASDDSSKPPTRPSSRRQSRTNTPRKRPRLESVDPSRVRKYYLEGKYNDAYRVLFNEDVSRAGARFKTGGESYQHYTTQIGASVWSSEEQTTLFSALERLGRDQVPDIASAIGTKSVPETQALLLLLQDAASKQGDTRVTLRDIPAAIEISNECSEQLDLAGEALAWYQESFEASQEQEKFGDYWLITSSIAKNIEDAVAGPMRANSTTPASEPEPPRRGGKVAIGSCTSCKQFKQKCDRGTPCGNCVRRKTEACVYKDKPNKPDRQNKQDLKPAISDGQASEAAGAPRTENSNILEAIPEATLLQPEIMLTLSRSLFMNRSPTISSPWLHWSEYTSELAEEPAMYRSAFNDLHTLAVSITRRLAQTALIQATSRLRSQRRRVKKGVQSLVKRRDVLAAIDILGMKRNGRERWRGVARRCSVRVYEGRKDYAQYGKHRKEVSWDEVERMMNSTEVSSGPATTDAETSGNDTESFKYRAARSGTPLPLDQLALSDSDSNVDIDGALETMAGSADSLHNEMRPATQPRDPFGRYTSVPPESDVGEPDLGLDTLEQFDQEASQHEEQALWQMLEAEPPAKDDEIKNDENNASLYGDGAVSTDPDGWRTWTDFHAEWEEFRTPVPGAKFLAHAKPSSPAPADQTRSSHMTPRSGDDSDISTTEVSRRHNAQTSKGIELRARGTRAYAALQERASEPYDHRQDSDDAGSGDDDDLADVPTQSIEDTSELLDPEFSDDEMDWEA